MSSPESGPGYNPEQPGELHNTEEFRSASELTTAPQDFMNEVKDFSRNAKILKAALNTLGAHPEFRKEQGKQYRTEYDAMIRMLGDKAIREGYGVKFELASTPKNRRAAAEKARLAGYTYVAKYIGMDLSKRSGTDNWARAQRELNELGMKLIGAARDPNKPDVSYEYWFKEYETTDPDVLKEKIVTDSKLELPVFYKKREGKLVFENKGSSDVSLDLLNYLRGKGKKLPEDFQKIMPRAMTYAEGRFKLNESVSPEEGASQISKWVEQLPNVQHSRKMENVDQWRLVNYSDTLDLVRVTYEPSHVDRRGEKHLSRYIVWGQSSSGDNVYLAEIRAHNEAKNLEMVNKYFLRNKDKWHDKKMTFAHGALRYVHDSERSSENSNWHNLDALRVKGSDEDLLEVLQVDYRTLRDDRA